MARYVKSQDGRYHIHSKTYDILIGTRAQVWHGTAYKTSGGLKKAHLMQNKSGRIVSEKKHFTAKRDNRLVKSGFGTKRGKFGWVKIGSRRGHSKRRHSKRQRGGMNAPSSSSGTTSSTTGSTTGSSSTNMQQMLAAKMAGQSGSSGSSTTSSGSTNSGSTSKH